MGNRKSEADFVFAWRVAMNAACAPGPSGKSEGGGMLFNTARRGRFKLSRNLSQSVLKFEFFYVFRKGLGMSTHCHLPVEIRLQALGLPAPAVLEPLDPEEDLTPRKASVGTPGGRPRQLTFNQRLRVGLLWRETYDGLAIRRSTRDPRLGPILKKMAQGRRRGLPEWQIGRLSRQADVIGRHYREEILPPKERLPAVDRLVAKKAGITVRMVRRIRSDERIKRLVGVPPWVPRQWEISDLREAWALRQARRLLTPERLAKPVHVVQACGTFGIKELIDQRPDGWELRHVYAFHSDPAAREWGYRFVDGHIPFRTGSELEIVPGAAPRGYHGGRFNADLRDRPDLVRLFKRNLEHWMRAGRVRDQWDELWGDPYQGPMKIA
jgi:hypothetical protein